MAVNRSSISPSASLPDAPGISSMPLIASAQINHDRKEMPITNGLSATLKKDYPLEVDDAERLNNLITAYIGNDNKASDSSALSTVSSALSAGALDTKHSAGFFNAATRRPTSSPVASLSESDKKTSAQSKNHSIDTNYSVGTTLSSYPLPELKDYGQPCEFLITQNGILLAYRKTKTFVGTERNYKLGFIKNFGEIYSDFPVIDFPYKGHAKFKLVKIYDGRIFACIIKSCSEDESFHEIYFLNINNANQIKKENFQVSAVRNWLAIDDIQFSEQANGKGLIYKTRWRGVVIYLPSLENVDINFFGKNAQQHTLLANKGISSKDTHNDPNRYTIGYPDQVEFDICMLKNGKYISQWTKKINNPSNPLLIATPESNSAISPQNDYLAISITVFDHHILKVLYSPPHLPTPTASYDILDEVNPNYSPKALTLLWLPDNSGLLFINHNNQCIYVAKNTTTQVIIGMATQIQFDLNARLLMTYEGRVTVFDFKHLALLREEIETTKFIKLSVVTTVRALQNIIDEYVGEEHSILTLLSYYSPKVIFSQRLTQELNNELQNLYLAYSKQILENNDTKEISKYYAIEYFYACLQDKSKTIAQCVRETIAEYPAIEEGYIRKPLKKLFDKILASDRTHANHAVLFPPLFTTASSLDKKTNEHPFIILLNNLQIHIHNASKNSINVELRVLKNGIESILAKAVEYNNKKVLFKTTINTMLSKIVKSINLIHDTSLQKELTKFVNEYKQPLASPNPTITAHAKK